MRPYQEKGRTPSSKKRVAGKKAVNEVRRTLVKAKANANKAKRRLGAGSKEEVRDLLEQSVNNGHVADTPASEKAKAKVRAKAKASPAKSKARRRVVEVDQVDGGKTKLGDPVQPPKERPGILQRTMSRIWRMPVEGMAGRMSYTDISMAEEAVVDEEKPDDAAKTSCTIS